MELIHDFLVTQELIDEDHILSYHGGLNQAQRIKVLDRSKKTIKPTVLLLQLQAGGVGLNLQEYDRIIFVSPWWTAALMDQAIARAVRIGQTKVVNIYHLRLDAEADSTINIDELVSQKAEQKRKMLEALFALCE
jgi:SNF2 family DNA or RNA helicase